MRGRKRGSRVRNGGVFRGLRASFGFFPIAIDVVVNRAIQAEGAKLYCCAVDLVTVPGHADRLELVKHASGIGRCARGRLGCSGGPSSLVKLLRSR